MMYLLIPIGLLAAFFISLVYLIFAKKDLKSSWRQLISPGLFFTGVWVIIYYLLLR